MSNSISFFMTLAKLFLAWLFVFVSIIYGTWLIPIETNKENCTKSLSSIWLEDHHRQTNCEIMQTPRRYLAFNYLLWLGTFYRHMFWLANFTFLNPSFINDVVKFKVELTVSWLFSGNLNWIDCCHIAC